MIRLPSEYLNLAFFTDGGIALPVSAGRVGVTSSLAQDSAADELCLGW
jgi:hypothetical protein